MTIIEPHEVHKARKLWEVLGVGVFFCFSFRNSKDLSMYLYFYTSVCVVLLDTSVSRRCLDS